MPLPEAELRLASDMCVGLSASFETDVTEGLILEFASLSGDFNPLHVDVAYAESTNYSGRIAHGAYQFGLASAMAGMHIPGKLSLLTTVESRFLAPLYFPTRVCVDGEIATWNPESLTGKLIVGITDLKNDCRVSEFAIRFTLHDRTELRQNAGRQLKTGETKKNSDSAKIVLVTGAAGGLGQHMLRELGDEYTLIAACRQKSCIGAEEYDGSIEEVILDLETDNWMDITTRILDGRSLYGIVHAAWPGMPRGGLMKEKDRVVDRQVDFGVKTTIELARCLAKHAPETGGRFVAIGSVVGSHMPNPAVAGYSLGKAVLENTVRLLAPELASKKILANVVTPAFLPIGINKQATQQQQMLEEAKIPLGRLCEPDDLAGVVKFLLSDQSAFMSGQILRLDGGRL